MKTLKKIMSLVQPGKITSLRFLNYAYRRTDCIDFTSLETFITRKNLPLVTGNYFIDGLLTRKNGSIGAENSIPYDVESWPKLPEITLEHELNPCIFDNVYSYAGYVDSDASRDALQYINYQENYGVWATDGHRVKVTAITGIPCDFSLSVHDAKIIDTLQKAGENIMNARISERIPGKDWRYMVINTQNYFCCFRVYMFLLPVVAKIIPKKEKQFIVELSTENTATLKAALKTIGAYANEKTNVVKMCGNKLSVYNQAIDKAVKITLPFNVTPQVEYLKMGGDGSTFTTDPEILKIGINYKYLLELLSNIKSGFSWGFYTRTSATTFYTPNELYTTRLLMPLHIIKDEEDEDLTGYTELPLPEVKKPTTTRKKTDKAKIKEIKAICEKWGGIAAGKIMEVINS